MNRLWTVAMAALSVTLSMSDAVMVHAPDRDDWMKLSSTIRSSSTSSDGDYKNHIARKAQVVDGSRACSVSDVLSDTCEFPSDGECDAGVYCPGNTDCLDCDPCDALHGNSCSSCQADPSCSYCQGIDASTQTPFGICTTVQLAQVFPDFCWIVSGNTGEFDGTTFAFGSANCNGVVDNNPSDTCDLMTDSCSYAFDGECDTSGDTPFCSAGTDCFDCDPCLAIVTDAIDALITDSNEICGLCAAAGCHYCTYPSFDGSNVALCSSPSIAFAMPNFCIDAGGSSYTDTCDITGTGSTPTPAPSPIGTSLTISICDFSNDVCEFAQDRECDADSATTFGGYCPKNSDCLDCDPCRAYRFDGCNSCVAAGCYWCASDALCLSTNPTISQNSTLPQLTCSTSGDFVQTCPTVDTTKIYSDPLYDAQNWVFEQIGVVDVWKSGITGAGIGIRINDLGVDATHLELSTKFDLEASCTEYAPVVLDEKHNHGTVCASIAAGSGNNGACSVGIAPNARISACRVINKEADENLADEAYDSSYFYAKMENMHISSNSYGIPTCIDKRKAWNRRLQQCPFVSTMATTPCLAAECSNVDWSNPSPTVGCEDAITIHCRNSFESDVQACTNFLDLFVKCEFNSLSMEEQDALYKGVTEGRNGKGIIYVFSGGNDFGSGADVNFAGKQSTRFSITVGAADKSGRHSSYSNSGAALFISAPGGDFDYYTNYPVALAGGGCIDAGVGTSYAAPVVAGVVALMLEANPNLSWRDVQGVVASTATQIQPSDPSWATNSAGLSHSYIYGFGMVNASKAVERSKTWTSLTPEIEIVADSEQVNVAIPEYPNAATTSTITVNATDSFKVESVTVYLDILHSSRGDLNIVLTSPSGTKSILSPGQRPENAQNVERWKLTTVRNRDEVARGAWTLSVVDQSSGDLSSCVDTLGWSTTVSSQLEEEDALDCDQFARSTVCTNGTEGPLFSTVFPGFSGLSDPLLVGTDGLTPDVACCACGGGLLASSLTDSLRSWRLAIYGNDPEAVIVPNPSPVASTPTSISSPGARPNPSPMMASSPTTEPATTPSNGLKSTSGFVGSTPFVFHSVGISIFTASVYYILMLH